MRRQPVREGVISIRVAIGERTVWLGCGQYTGPQGFLPFCFHGNRAAGAELQIPKTIKGWTALHTQLLFPSTAAEKGKQQVGAGKGWRHVWSCPQLSECPKAIAVSLTTPASPPQAPSRLRPSPNPFTKGSRTSPLLPWDIGAGASRSPVPIWARPGLGHGAAAQALISARRLESLTTSSLWLWTPPQIFRLGNLERVQPKRGVEK